MVKGECNCQSVEFQIEADLKDVYLCHCSICRRLTGSQAIAVAIVENDKFRWLNGEENIATWNKPNADWQTWFCRTCGSPVPGKNDADRMFVPVSLITEGGDHLKIAHQIYVGSKAAWYQIGDAGMQHDEAFS